MCSGQGLVSIPGEVEVEQAASGGQNRYSIIVAYKYSVRLSLQKSTLSAVITCDSHVIGARIIVKAVWKGSNSTAINFNCLESESQT